MLKLDKFSPKKLVDEEMARQQEKSNKDAQDSRGSLHGATAGQPPKRGLSPGAAKDLDTAAKLH